MLTGFIPLGDEAAVVMNTRERWLRLATVSLIWPSSFIVPGQDGVLTCNGNTPAAGAPRSR